MRPFALRDRERESSSDLLTSGEGRIFYSMVSGQ